MSGSPETHPADGLEAPTGAATRLPSDATSATQDVLLDVRDLSVVYESAGQTAVQAVDHVSFQLRKGEFVGLVGESGSGKSTLGYALTRLQKPPARTNGGSIVFAGKDIRDLDDEALRQQRQGGFAMVLQSGMNALNPVRTIRNHFIDVFKAHGHVPRDRWDARMKELIEKVKLPASMLARFPGELSGGMRQRVSIALALSLEPQLMVFDEPTTALDVLVQHAVMDTIIELQRTEGFTAILISHDLGIVLEATERVLVMHEGRIVEDGGSREILRDPQDEYTQMLLSHYADPRAEVVSLPGFPDRSLRDPSATRQETTSSFSTVGSRERSAARNPIVVDHIVKTYPAPRRGEQPVQAVRDVSFTLEPGQSLALVGQSGSGKSTIAKLLTGVEKPTTGTVRFGDLDVARLGKRGLRDLRSEVQMVFQDPYSALNPLHTVEYTLSRPIANYTGLTGRDARRRVLELLETVGLTPVEQFAQKLPHQLSGGQRQRVVIARALASDPQVIIADEPVSMLDVTLRAGVLALLEDLREQWGVSLLYITHDLLSARLITDDIMVLHEGAVVERGHTAQVLQDPQDPYTIALLDAVPNPRRTLVEGRP
ncbi:ABC transporter ATP-binding protein [Curtobacterium flaccumfaciens]|uniref:ABC transporter ATP-binding protein n=1 Tax=Curtobacterium poinsettiae TaxID=159612 RepID=A0A9Q9PB34_9MICO|nr:MULTISPECIES: ABC transporter ATP-binding protein [Curtobacterium]UXN26992.1 ABC transporter ATP-binding protein [Curtobacterium flaccumfaciens]UYC81835.1 ABC transporter ATP-binding protein [Curtobacterium flaccumfaciens pv. poinsettiae]